MYATVYVVRIIFPKFVRTYGTCMHHDKSLLNICIVPPLIDFLLGYVTLIHYDLVSRELHVLLVQMAAPAGSESFLFGESCTMRGIMNRPSITRMKYTLRDSHGMKCS